tara:strand:+ start:126 stop:1082 length:957 start_codon:yes stop_codon:yes gene_type:complete
MNDSFLRVFQRGIRSNLSFCFNKKEYINPKIKSLIHLVFKMSDEIVISKKSNRKKTHKIFSKKVFYLVRNKQFLNFLQKSFIQQMFFIHNRFYLFSYLKKMRSSKKWKFWKKIIQESPVGNPVRYFLYPKSSGNKIFQAYHLKKYEDYSKVNLKSFSNVIEFGGGYGNMACIFHKINPQINYTIFDTYEVSLLQYYYLNRLNLKVNFNKLSQNKNSIDLISSINILKLKISKINNNKKTLLIANWSISETPLQFRKKFYFLFKKFEYQLISFQKKFEDIDNQKFFLEVSTFNKIFKRKSKIIPIEKMSNHFYLFSKKN